MMPATPVTVEEYLRTSYSPDCDYVDGVVLDRNLGEHDHARLQTDLAAFFRLLERSLNIFVVVEQRVQVAATRFRVPDVCVLRGGDPGEQIITRPPFLCIEILSPEDRVAQMQIRVEDYLAFGVENVWVIDPVTKHAQVYSPQGFRLVSGGLLRTSEPDIEVNLFQVLP